MDAVYFGKFPHHIRRKSMYLLTPYNVIKKVNEYFLIYNTLSAACIAIDKNEFETYKKNNFSTVEKELFEYLVNSYIIAEVDSDFKKIFNFVKQEVYTQTKHLGITLIPSRRCNLRCTYCFQNNLFQNDKYFEYTKETVDKIVFWLREHIELWDSKEMTIIFYGGEPLTTNEKILQYLFDEINKLSIKINYHMITNGTLIPQHYFVLKNVSVLRVTVDGPKEIHDSRRIKIDGKGTYVEILNNIKGFLNENPDKKISVRINVDKNNRDTLIETIKNILKIIETERISFNLHPVEPYSKEITVEDIHGDIRETARKMVECYNYLSEKGIEPFIWSVNCGINTISQWVFDTDGSIFKCSQQVGHTEDAVSHIDNHIFNKEFYKIMSREYDDECQLCKYVGVCDGGCYQQEKLYGKKHCMKTFFDVYLPNMLEIKYRSYLNKKIVLEGDIK